MNKSTASKLLQQTGLQGEVDKALWTVSDDRIKIQFKNSQSTLIGFIDVSNDIIKDVPTEFITTNVSTLNKMVSVLSDEGDLAFELKKKNSANVALYISDSNKEVQFTLASLDMINFEKLNQKSDYIYTAVVEGSDYKTGARDLIDTLIRGAQALDPEEFRFSCSKGKATFEIGNEGKATNKIKIVLNTDSDYNVSEMRFAMKSLKNILACNKDCEKVSFKFTPQAMQIVFGYKDINAVYFLVELNDDTE